MKKVSDKLDLWPQIPTFDRSVTSLSESKYESASEESEPEAQGASARPIARHYYLPAEYFWAIDGDDNFTSLKKIDQTKDPLFVSYPDNRDINKLNYFEQDFFNHPIRRMRPVVTSARNAYYYKLNSESMAPGYLQNQGRSLMVQTEMSREDNKFDKCPSLVVKPLRPRKTNGLVKICSWQDFKLHLIDRGLLRNAWYIHEYMTDRTEDLLWRQYSKYVSETHQLNQDLYDKLVHQAHYEARNRLSQLNATVDIIQNAFDNVMKEWQLNHWKPIYIKTKRNSLESDDDFEEGGNASDHESIDSNVSQSTC